MMTISRAMQRATTDKVARWVAIFGFLFGLPLYLITIPASLTGGHIGWSNLRFLTTGMTLFALAMSLLLALTLLLMVFLIREGRRARSGLAASGTLLGLLTPLLCCSPILPLLLGLLAVVFPTLASAAAGSVQSFIARHETAFLVPAVLLMALALHQNARWVLRGTSCRIR